MMEEIRTFIEYFELDDGEIFGIQQVDRETGEILNQILMERQMAIEMAIDILKIFSLNQAILPPIK